LQLLILEQFYKQDRITYGARLISGHAAFLFILILSLKAEVDENTQHEPQY